MVQPKALASLSSSLLARKGAARPAMRPQGFGGGFGNAATPLDQAGLDQGGLDDLGWNDMGSPEPVPVPVPPVLVEREVLKEQFEVRPTPMPSPTPTPVVQAVKTVSVATAARISRESAKQTSKSKAAFTLRLDGERHLRLRLASAVSNRSSQQLVTQALDIFLQTLPEVDALVAQLPPPKPGRSKTGDK